ncbi:hypothetical protein [Chitinimonas sp. BJYL2]|uniref:hypothetical protein n=1 Tax=Chitinimonas sp. BJYL2 TaxID=2976696 RepID=UPI0022B4C424|nr:hypothetical protein [Chitinimonas sp. BJYL2]
MLEFGLLASTLLPATEGDWAVAILTRARQRKGSAGVASGAGCLGADEARRLAAAGIAVLCNAALGNAPVWLAACGTPVGSAGGQPCTLPRRQLSDIKRRFSRQEVLLLAGDDLRHLAWLARALGESGYESVFVVDDALP